MKIQNDNINNNNDNDNDNINTDVEKILHVISSLEKKDHIIIGSIFQKYPAIKLNENKSGIMINSNTVPDSAWKEVDNYLNYIYAQNNILDKIENETEELKKYYS